MHLKQIGDHEVEKSKNERNKIHILKQITDLLFMNVEASFFIPPKNTSTLEFFIFKTDRWIQACDGGRGKK